MAKGGHDLSQLRLGREVLEHFVRVAIIEFSHLVCVPLGIRSADGCASTLHVIIVTEDDEGFGLK